MKCTSKILSVTGFLLLICINTINAQGACLTPSNQNGECILVQNCTVLMNIILESQGQLTTQQENLILSSRCSTDEDLKNERYKVCCPPIVSRITQTSLTEEVSYTPTDYTNHSNAPSFNLRSCGILHTEKISMGNKTQPFEFRWMAIIQYKNLYNQIEQKCGGSIITLRYVLTAAHCISWLRGGDSLHSVVVGEHNIKTDPDCFNDECAPSIQTILINRAIPHPSYNRRLFTNDIGVLRLQSLIEQNDATLRICLPITLEMQTQTLSNLMVTGWGTTEYGSRSDELVKALLPTVPVDECNRQYNAKLRGPITLSEIHLCAGGDQSDACSGDSGGPASTNIPSSFGPRVVQYGIVSAGSSTCDVSLGIPGLYASIVHYMKWILDTCDE